MDGIKLPDGFIESLACVMGDDMQDFLQSYGKDYVRALRLNPYKKVDSHQIEGLGEKVPWEDTGYYLDNASRAGADILHQAGAFYIQEASAMAPVRVLQPQKGERVLDLCAAPGGKATQIAASLAGEGLLVANEPVWGRAKILSQNIERMGIDNAIVTSAMPETLSAKWQGFFDAILVDAPCSGEGMFRRHPETRLEWTAQAPSRCAQRQKSILSHAVEMLKPGGRLCYSTCTLNPVENEGVCKWLLDSHPQMNARPFTLEGVGQAQKGYLRLLPHRIKGEGHFVALFQKEGPMRDTVVKMQEGLDTSPVTEVDFPLPHKPNASLGATLVSVPPYPALQGIKVLRAGLHLGQLKGKHFIPDHALAIAKGNALLLPCRELDRLEAAKYLHGEAVEGEGRGYQVVCYQGLPLGFVKASEGWLKNHFPKGLRRSLVL